jgi:hypothetical protein
MSSYVRISKTPPSVYPASRGGDDGQKENSWTTWCCREVRWGRREAVRDWSSWRG